MDWESYGWAKAIHKPSRKTTKIISAVINHEDVKLNLDEIIRINAMKDYIIIYTVTRKLIVHQTMKSIMEKINLENFIRVHN